MTCSPSICLFLALSFVASGSSSGQEAPAAGSPQRSTIGESLQKLGIKTDQSSLVNALGDTRPRVRGLAAIELASVRALDAKPKLEEALNIEADPVARFNIAMSLSTLGDSLGEKVLGQYCSSADDSFASRAASILASQHDYECLASMVGWLDSPSVSKRQSSLLYLHNLSAQFKELPSSLGPKLLLMARQDPDEAIRDLAGKTIMEIGDATTKASFMATH